MSMYSTINCVDIYRLNLYFAIFMPVPHHLFAHRKPAFSLATASVSGFVPLLSGQCQIQRGTDPDPSRLAKRLEENRATRKTPRVLRTIATARSTAKVRLGALRTGRRTDAVTRQRDLPETQPALAAPQLSTGAGRRGPNTITARRAGDPRTRNPTRGRTPVRPAGGSR